MKVGDKVKTFRGENATVRSFRTPHKPSSEGKISIMIQDFNEEVYVGVIGAKWIEREDREAEDRQAASRVGSDRAHHSRIWTVGPGDDMPH